MNLAPRTSKVRIGGIVGGGVGGVVHDGAVGAQLSARPRYGLRPLQTTFSIALDSDSPEACQRQLLEAGCVIAFVLNAAPEAVTTAHQAFQKALARGELRPSHIEALEQALRDHEVELREFASQ